MILIGEANRLDLRRLIVRELFLSPLLASNYSYVLFEVAQS